VAQSTKSFYRPLARSALSEAQHSRFRQTLRWRGTSCNMYNPWRSSHPLALVMPMPARSHQHQHHQHHQDLNHGASCKVIFGSPQADFHAPVARRMTLMSPNPLSAYVPSLPRPGLPIPRRIPHPTMNTRRQSLKFPKSILSLSVIVYREVSFPVLVHPPSS
jgi:hypothetical protein